MLQGLQHTLPLAGVPAPRLMEQVRQAMQARGRARATEEAYCHWIRRYIFFHGKRHPNTLGAAEVEQFLAHLAGEERVSASTQNLALSALLFLYGPVLKQPLDRRVALQRPRRGKHLPAVLSVAEVRSLLAQMSGTTRLMAELTYGAGLRLLEVHRLRVQDLDFPAQRILVVDGKGRKDRYTLLPKDLAEPLQAQLALVARLHAADLAQGLGSVVLPHAYDRRSREASRHLRWQFVFASAKTFHDPRTGNTGRWHLHPSGLQNAVRAAADRAGLTKRVSVHTLRHSFATHLLQDGCDIRSLQALLGHTNLNTTMLYAHIKDSLELSVSSPLDRHHLHEGCGA